MCEVFESKLRHAFKHLQNTQIQYFMDIEHAHKNRINEVFIGTLLVSSIRCREDEK